MRGEVPDIRECVIAIQGGGVFGLSLLGQAAGVLERKANPYSPLAFAGTSAGAIVATLLWAGLSPSTIYQRLSELSDNANPKQRLGQLLGTFDGIKPEELKPLEARLKAVASDLLAGGSLSALGAILRARGLKRELEPAIAQRGVFPADALEAWIEDCIRGVEGLPPALRDKATPLTFGDYMDAALENRAANYRPPLILTTTNLSTGRLELIKSYHVKFRGVSVAAAARASGSFPVAIRPRDLQDMPSGGTFADGGISANFPLWVFSQSMRDELSVHPLYRWIAYRPWLRIGLSVVDDADGFRRMDSSKDVAVALVRMLTRGTRNELEDHLNSTLPHVYVVRQPFATTDGPAGVLDLHELDPKKIKSMFDKGREKAEIHLQEVGNPALYDPSADVNAIMLELADLVDRAARRFNPKVADPSTLFRSNVFLLQQTGFVMSFSTGSRGSFEFPSTRSGIAGVAYTARRPALCNRDAARDLAQSDPATYKALFGIAPSSPPGGQASASASSPTDDPKPATPTWTLSAPIFDPQEARLRPLATNHDIELDQHQSLVGFAAEPAAYGPVIGVLNLDGLWTYEEAGLDPDVTTHLSDPRVRDVLEAIQSAAVRIARILAWKGVQR